VLGLQDGEDGYRLTFEQALLATEVCNGVLARCGEVVDAGAIPLLVALCAGPDGPLPEIVDQEGREEEPVVAEQSAAKGKKGKKAKKAKAAKLEPGALLRSDAKMPPDRRPLHVFTPDANASAHARLACTFEQPDARTCLWPCWLALAGMAECHVYASACLRLLSLSEDAKGGIMAAGAARYLGHLLESKVELARWHARQTLLNLAMVPEHAKELAQYGYPDYITGGNIPAVRPKHRPAALTAESVGGSHGDTASCKGAVPKSRAQASPEKRSIPGVHAPWIAGLWPHDMQGDRTVPASSPSCPLPVSPAESQRLRSTLRRWLPLQGGGQVH
jgi:hypothetical protein